MKKIESEFQDTGIMKAIDLFNRLLEKSDYNLNQFVKGDSLTVPNDKSESFTNILKEFVEMVPDAIQRIENGEVFWSAFEKLDDYESNDKFIRWMQRYVDAVIRPMEEAAFLKEMDEETFKRMTEYCFDNFVLKDIGRKNIDKSVGNLKDIITLRKMIFTYIEMIVVDNFAEERAHANMERLFGIRKQYCGIWSEYIERNADKIWKIMLMKRYNRIENKLNQILESIND